MTQGKKCLELKQGRYLLHTCATGPRISFSVACLTSQQQASVSQGRKCSGNCMCCHTEIEAADQTFYLTQSQYTDTKPISPSADPLSPDAWQGSHWSFFFFFTGMTGPGKIPSGKAGIKPRSAAHKAVALSARPTRQS